VGGLASIPYVKWRRQARGNEAASG
jgi:hypothetical protein